MIGIDDFRKNIRFKLGSRDNISFWKDLLVGEAPLKETYSNIFRPTLEPYTFVANCFDINKRC